MHEWALAESIITTVLQAAEKEKLKTIIEIIIRIGELQQIEQDIFEFALQEIMNTEKRQFNHTKITIEQEKSMLHCKNCEHIWSFDELKKKLNEDESEAIHFVPEVAFVHARCPKCGSPDFTIEKGRGISILSIKGEK
jgi:hydrogenase nickel incorporation protein HypA/HybF